MNPAGLPRAALCISLLDTIISSMSPSSGNAPFWLMTDAAQELIQTAKGRVYRVTHRTAAAAARAAATEAALHEGESPAAAEVSATENQTDAEHLSETSAG